MRLADPDGGPLLAWYDNHGRDLPWRRTREPYPVWVSEIMLQQTQVATALPFYERWMRELPDLDALAERSEEGLLALWQGLGYYRRARLLQDGARYLLKRRIASLNLRLQPKEASVDKSEPARTKPNQSEQGDLWPASSREWLEVPGVGPYTAAAIASICLNEPSAVVDGNVERVYARVCADPATGSALLKNARQWAQSQMFAQRPGDWNQAMMELGATICTPRNPKCDACPIRERCSAQLSGRENEFPKRTPKPTTIEMRFRIEIPFDGKRFGVRPIESARWWKGMWEFPTASELTTPSPTPPSSRKLDKGGAQKPPPYARNELEEGVGGGVNPWSEYLGEIRHVVTHHRLIYSVELMRVESLEKGIRAATATELLEIPLPSPQNKALQMAIRALGLTETPSRNNTLR